MKVNAKISLSNEERILIKTIAELYRIDNGEILMKTIVKEFAKNTGRDYNSVKVAKLLDEIDKKILINMNCGFAKRIRRGVGTLLCLSNIGLGEAKRLLEEK